jgi:hypothetical protein
MDFVVCFLRVAFVLTFVGCCSIDEAPHDAMMLWYVKFDDDNCLATSGKFMKSLLISMSGIVVT